MIEREELVAWLHRQFRGGPLRRLPRNPADADVLLALALTGLDADAAHEESAVNMHLFTWCSGIAAEDGLDHVTLRRWLVDCGFLRRSSDGVIYRVVRERIDALLAPDAQSVDARQILEAVETERSERRRAFGP